MGSGHSSKNETFDGKVNFDHFQILRAIGKGSFGKVCIVQKKDSKLMFAMKYMNKAACIQQDAINNVIKEVEILRKVDHVFIVNLWYCFQDEEDMFMVVDLLLGGDLRYHMQEELQFTEQHLQLYLAELAFALDYLRSKSIVHRPLQIVFGKRQQDVQVQKRFQKVSANFHKSTARPKFFGTSYVATQQALSTKKDYFMTIKHLRVLRVHRMSLKIQDIKPDNILLDEEGHVHITDFNIASELKQDKLATSLSGTKPYMAPEIFKTAIGEVRGYSFPVDWWALGVTLYELVKKRRPFNVQTDTNPQDTLQILCTTKVNFPCNVSNEMNDVLRQLLHVNPEQRLQSSESLVSHPVLSSLNMEQVKTKAIKPLFVPSKEHLNCDPTYELEEMIIETKPLHKKKKRLAKQSSKKDSLSSEMVNKSMDDLFKGFPYYNREVELNGGCSSVQQDIPELKTSTTVSTSKSRMLPSSETGSEQKLIREANSCSASLTES